MHQLHVKHPLDPRRRGTGGGAGAPETVRNTSSSRRSSRLMAPSTSFQRDLCADDDTAFQLPCAPRTPLRHRVARLRFAPIVRPVLADASSGPKADRSTKRLLRLNATARSKLGACSATSTSDCTAKQASSVASTISFVADGGADAFGQLAHRPARSSDVAERAASSTVPQTRRRPLEPASSTCSKPSNGHLHEQRRRPRFPAQAPKRIGRSFRHGDGRSHRLPAVTARASPPLLRPQADAVGAARYVPSRNLWRQLLPSRRSTGKSGRGRTHPEQASALRRVRLCSYGIGLRPSR